MTDTLCTNCQNVRWVCEAHTDKPWDETMDDGCECGAGQPCAVCNPSGGPDEPPKHMFPPGTIEVRSTRKH